MKTVVPQASTNLGWIIAAGREGSKPGACEDRSLLTSGLPSHAIRRSARLHRSTRIARRVEAHCHPGLTPARDDRDRRSHAACRRAGATVRTTSPGRSSLCLPGTGEPLRHPQASRARHGRNLGGASCASSCTPSSSSWSTTTSMCATGRASSGRSPHGSTRCAHHAGRSHAHRLSRLCLANLWPGIEDGHRCHRKMARRNRS